MATTPATAHGPLTLRPSAVSTVGLIFLILTAVMVVFFIGGLIAVSVRSKRGRRRATSEHVREADQALEVRRAPATAAGTGS